MRGIKRITFSCLLILILIKRTSIIKRVSNNVLLIKLISNLYLLIGIDSSGAIVEEYQNFKAAVASVWKVVTIDTSQSPAPDD